MRKNEEKNLPRATAKSVAKTISRNMFIVCYLFTEC